MKKWKATKEGESSSLRYEEGKIIVCESGRSLCCYSKELAHLGPPTGIG